MRTRTIPFILRKSVYLEPVRLSENILKQIDHSEWTTLIVILQEYNSSVRIYGDYRATINVRTENNKHHFSRNEELFAKLSGSKMFTIFDLKDAYFQHPVDGKSSKIFTLNTHKGLFSVHMLPFETLFSQVSFRKILRMY